MKLTGMLVVSLRGVMDGKPIFLTIQVSLRVDVEPKTKDL